MHTIFDWFLQSRMVAENKSKSWLALEEHVFIYFIGLLIAMFILPFDAANGFIWAVVNAVLHFITDAITSRVNAYSYQRGRIKCFWNGIGFDQYIHYVTLFGTYLLLK